MIEVTNTSEVAICDVAGLQDLANGSRRG
jgi:hypothetical protein